ncbi:hypothetical protein AHFPHNDE_02961 [Pseudomonas sp. MM227]|uniref:DUF2790 domain-containing protein n=1 Tax=Pseudomonas baltica TaxID=2762576 RepID=A0A7X1G6W5_9PSED|nr:MULTISPECIES: DUF2790 domain-containing protein [Pseudomonas]MBC2678804.1 DUF2790 domain-containing protein [Pseudomonas baltica]MBD8473293.1 DUF2790 domain-containing protein [Pseudomonas sp. CFBP 8773]MBD8592058.1 DUF2790 domain-containing protein [Pseudomonas sp. CFBP 8758]MBD8604664.1 DUF2790 domain-containing protein [Pseudomonas sp. CFBP 8771]MBD8622936.1 DUF2790 domain-containing protein [Pseudomonas sp. CFBP 13727]
MKAFLILALIGASGMALADETTTAATEKTTVEPYEYSQHPDIAHVISTSAIPNVCAVVPARLTYEDSQGKRHIMEYQVMGNGCSNS